MKLSNTLFSFALIVVILISTFVSYRIFNVQNPSAVQNGFSPSPFYVGVEFGYGNASDCKLLIDKVKNYTNLLVISSTNITQNEALLNETCDYAYASGMHIIIYFPQSYYGGSSSAPYVWAMKAKDKYGSYFLGSYIYDETGGEVLDRAAGAVSVYSITSGGGPYATAVDYKSATNNFVTNAHNQMDSFLYCGQKSATSVMTADYGLYWFDYLAGYDTVLAEFGWGNNRQMAIALCRGAATAQKKDWGAIICWEAHTNSTGHMENGTALYNDLLLAYTNGAKYAVIFDYAGKDSVNNRDLPNPYQYGILNEEHFAALEKFWNYIQQNPREHGSVEATTALVLPQYYGFGFRRVNDKIWGLDQADNWTIKIWNDANLLLGEYGGRLDIVYSDAEFQPTIAKEYSTLIAWTSGASTDDYPVVNLNSTLGYDSIQKAISSGATAGGDTVFVKSGTYQENVIISKPIVLLGENKENTIIDASNNGSGLIINSANVTVKDFKIKNANSPEATDLYGNDSALALNQLLIQTGIDPQQFAELSPTLAQSLVNQLMPILQSSYTKSASTSSGIYLSYSDNCNLTDNIVSNCTCGIILASSTNITMRNNTMMNVQYGFGVCEGGLTNTIYASFPAQYRQDIDDSNMINGKPIYYLINQEGFAVPSNAGYVAIVNCSNVIVRNLQLSHNYNGLVVVDSKGSTIANNTLANNYEGLRISGTSENTFQNNDLTRNVCNLAADSISADIDFSNKVNGKPIYVWVDQHNKTIPKSAGFVALVNCSGITVSDVCITDNDVGVLLQNTSNCTIVNSTFANMTSGIRLSAATGIVVVNNSITACQDGILMENESKENIISGNLISQNLISGISAQSSTNNTIQNNHIAGNGNGVLLADASGNTVKDNLISANRYGIDFSGSNTPFNTPSPDGSMISTCTNNLVIENNITQNVDGIMINYDVTGNMFYRNNFQDNANQAYTSYTYYSSTIQNSWDNGKEGNYWGNYNGTDTNTDGIGDQPLDVFQQYQQVTVNGVAQTYPVVSDVDHFPLMQPI